MRPVWETGGEKDLKGLLRRRAKKPLNGNDPDWNQGRIHVQKPTHCSSIYPLLHTFHNPARQMPGGDILWVSSIT